MEKRSLEEEEGEKAKKKKAVKKQPVEKTAPNNKSTTLSVSVGGLRTVEVDAAEVVRCATQFLFERGLHRSAETLQNESGVGLDAVEDLDGLLNDVKAGRWDAALPVVNRLEMPVEVLTSLHEHLAKECLDAGDVDAFKAVVANSAPLQRLRREDPDRARSLDDLARRFFAKNDRGASSSKTRFDLREKYASLGATNKGGVDERASSVWGDETSKEARRAAIAADLRGALKRARPSRLENLVGHALRWRAHCGLLSPKRRPAARRRLRLFADDDDDDEDDDDDNAASSSKRRKKSGQHFVQSDDKPVRKAAGVIAFGSGCRATCAIFTRSDALVTGSSDGFVEIWDWKTCRLRTDLAYQARDELLLHDAAVSAAGVRYLSHISVKLHKKDTVRKRLICPF